MACFTCKVVNDIRNRLISHLERSLYQEPLILEDSLGRPFEITLQFTNSWEAFDAIIEVHFRNQQGHRMVQQKRYVLHESIANRDIDRRFPWEAELQPGQKIVMCMLFDDRFESKGCPKCHLVSENAEDADVKW